MKISEQITEQERKIHVTQERFLISGPTQDPTLWHIPLTLISHTAGKMELPVLTNQSGTFNVKGIPASEWIKFNANQVGIYRCIYSPEMLAKLQQAVEKLELSPTDRLGIQNDLFALARAGFVSTVEALKTFSRFVNENDYTGLCIEITLSDGNLIPHLFLFLSLV